MCNKKGVKEEEEEEGKEEEYKHNLAALFLIDH